MSATQQTEADRLCEEIRTAMRERAGNTVMLPLSHACDIHIELRRLDSLCDERGANEARMLMRCTEMQTQINQLRAQLATAAAEEREECAKVCEYQADRFMQASPLEGNRPYASHECAAAIRARRNT